MCKAFKFNKAKVVMNFGVNKSKSLNSYYIAAELFKQRIFWDFNLLSWKSRKRLKSWRDKYSKEKALILCNGPSLNNVDFGLIGEKGWFTFGLNKINLLFNKKDFRPSAIVSVDPDIISQNVAFYNKTNIPIFLDSYGKNIVRFRENIVFLHSVSYLGKFAEDCSFSVNQGYTVTYVAMQLAFHMGFETVGLLGCDHSFHVERDIAKVSVLSEGNDKNHFHPDYFVKGQKYDLPDVKMMEIHYKKAREVFECNNKKIFNCTENSKLEVFEKLPLEEFIEI